MPFPPPATPESWRTRLARWGYAWIPAWRGTGARITHIAADWSEIRIRLPLSWRTRNYVGTIFGGSMYAALDPFYMVQLIQRLGPGHVVWDKAAEIRFKRPGRGTLFASFRVDEAEIEAIRAALVNSDRVEREYTVELVDAAGEVHAVCKKLLHVRRKPADASGS